MHRIADWWDSLELWVAGLPFIPQFVIAMAVMIPVAFGVAWTLDKILNAILRVLGRRGDSAAKDMP